MQEQISFGGWLRKQRRALNLSRQVFADQVGCAELTLRRIEEGTLKPSKELASVLIEKLGIPESEQSRWVSFARGLTGFPPQSTLSIAPQKEQSEVTRLITQGHRARSVPILRAQLFGGFSLIYDNTFVTGANSSRLQSLLTFLILHTDVPQSRQQVACLFWPDTSESQARNNLRQFLFQLRQTLPDSDRFLQVDTNTILWKTDEKQMVDVLLFKQALKDADVYNQHSDESLQRVALEKAVSLYQGDLLPGSYEEWIESEREGLRQQSQNAHRKLVQILEMQREYTLALTIAQRLLNLDPLDEGTYATLIRLHALNDDLSGARRVYQNALETLQRELGVEPSEMLRSTYQRLQFVSQVIVAQDENTRSTVKSFKLVGRQLEWQRLQAAWRSTVDGNNAHLVLITGEAGIGKSRLAEEMFHWVMQQGFSTAYSRSYGVEGRLSLGPVTDLLRSENIRSHIPTLAKAWIPEIARLLPELLIEHPDLAYPTPISEFGQRQFFFEALARAVHAGQHPLLLWIDDLHWSDKETLEWLHFLLRFEASGALFILGTARSEESPPEHPLSLLARQLRMEDKISAIELSPLDAAETAKLASEVQGYALEDRDSIRLFRETEGNPLFVVETVRAQVAGSEAVETDRTSINISDEVQLPPPRVHAVIVGRLVHLSSLARNVAEIGSAIGRSFPLDLLLQGEYTEKDVIFALNELWQKRIIREQSANIFDFTHDKLREITYLEISTPKRRLLHRNIAQALQNLHVDDLEPISGQLALHYERAGLVSQALGYYQKATIWAQQIFAHHEAIRLLLKALTMLETLPPSKERDEQELALQISLAISVVSTKGYGAPEVWKACRRAQQLCDQLKKPLSSPVLRALAIAHLSRTEFNEALVIGNQLLERAKQEQDNILLVEAHYILGVTLSWQGAFHESNLHLEQALALYDPAQAHVHITLYSQDPKAICVVRQTLNLACLGYPERANQASQASHAYALELSHPFTRGYIMYWDTLHYQYRREIQKTRELAEATIKFCSDYQLEFWYTSAVILRGWALAEETEPGQGIAEMENGISAFDAIGGGFLQAYRGALLAEQYGRQGDMKKGLTLVDEGIARVERSGEGWCEAELFRIKGRLLQIQGEVIEAEIAFRRAIAIAHRQEAKLLELRAALSLARLWPTHLCPMEVKQLVTSLYEWFSEGFDLPDLVAARDLLEEF